VNADVPEQTELNGSKVTEGRAFTETVEIELVSIQPFSVTLTE